MTATKPRATTSATAKKTTRKPTAKTEPPAPIKNVPSYQLPCIRGVQSGREYWTTMIPLKLLPKLFTLETDEMPAEMRAQRKLNVGRAHKLKDYVLESERYTLSSVTVTIEVPNEQTDSFNFTSIQGDIGTLNVPMDSKFLIADGQHRIAGLKLAMLENSDLQDESISCVAYLHTSLKRAQTIFHDLNHYGVKPNKSLNLLYDHHSDESELARQVMKKVPIFTQYTDTETTSVGSKSSKVFTFNAIDEANKYLFTNSQLSKEDKVTKAIAFWNAVTAEIPEWQLLLSKQYAPGEVRKNFLCGHAIALCGLAHLGFYVLKKENWQEELSKVNLGVVNWSKSNPEFENRIIFSGQIRKNKASISALGEWLWRQGMLPQENVEGHVIDWLREHFKGWVFGEVEQVLEDGPQQNAVVQECESALSLHCEHPTFMKAWSEAARQVKQERRPVAVS